LDYVNETVDEFRERFDVRQGTFSKELQKEQLTGKDQRVKKACSAVRRSVCSSALLQTGAPAHAAFSLFEV